MGRITTTTGLASGLDINTLVEQLVSFRSRPRNVIAQQLGEVQARQTAVTQITASVLAIQLSTDSLGDESLFNATDVSVSNTNLINTTTTGTPSVGTYEFTPVQQSQTQQLLSSGFASRDSSIGTGSVTFRAGGEIDKGVDLQTLNGGLGVQRGRIKITDRSGDSATVDLRFARNIDDVLRAINSEEGINVTASVDGDAIKLTDDSGATTSNLRVQDVGLTSTAADLGLDGIDVAAASATGDDVYRLYDQLALSSLNDGSGISFDTGLADLEITFQDNSAALQIDFAATAESTEVTLADVVSTINAADPTRLSAQISASGDSIELTDLTADSGGTFSVSSVSGGTVAEDLGLTGTASGGVITSERLLGGLKSSLLSSLAGGQGLDLGTIDVTDRSGATASIDLSSANTLEDVVQAFNSSGLSISASVNDARNGIEISDNSGATSSNFIISNGDGTNSADALKIATDAAVTEVNSGSLGLQTISEGTLLSSLNNGAGVGTGSFLLTDSDGATSSISFASLQPTTLGDVIDAINGLSIDVEAKINETGDGIALVDNAGGSGVLTVTDVGSGTTAADLKIAGTGETKDINGVSTHLIDGSTAVTIDISGTDSLDDLVTKINESGAGVTASVLSTGAGATPFRLSLTSDQSGTAGQFFVDTTNANFQVQTLAAAEDALLVVGPADTGVLVSSSSNVFDSVLDGVSLTVDGTSSSPVSVTVEASEDSLVSAVGVFVESYNRFVDQLDELTFFNEENGTTGPLQGTTEALRLERDLGSLVTSRFTGLGSIESLVELGIDVADTGKLSLDKDKLTAKVQADRDGVKDFFITEDTGVSAKFKTLTERLAGVEDSVLANRLNSLQTTINIGSDRIEFLDEQLATERDRLLNDFLQMELTISRLQSNLTALSSLQTIAPGSVNLGI